MGIGRLAGIAIGLIAAAVVGGYFFADPYFWTGTVNTAAGVVTGTPAAQTTAVQKSIRGQYRSAALGVAFTYDPTTTGVLEQGSSIYVYSLGGNPLQGQRLDMFPKQSGESLEQAIRERILAGYDERSCAVEASTQGAYMQAEITYPAPSDPSAPFWQNAPLCNAAYDRAGGIRYFLYDSGHPDRFYFLDLGQYAIAAPSGQPWQDTITIQ